MSVYFDREAFFDSVRPSLFHGEMTQSQVDGMEALLSVWEKYGQEYDLRWFANSLAQTYHETSQEMQPISEYGKGEGAEYGETDPETGQAYYGRGFIQLTWRDNYARADRECGYVGEDSCEWHADNALDPHKAARIMYLGMAQGWFRKDEQGVQNFARYFSEQLDDPFGAREIINGDKNKVPSWSNGVSIGNLIKGYHKKFLTALETSQREDEDDEDDGGDVQPAPTKTVEVLIRAPRGVSVIVKLDNGEGYEPLE